MEVAFLYLIVMILLQILPPIRVLIKTRPDMFLVFRQFDFLLVWAA